MVRSPCNKKFFLLTGCVEALHVFNSISLIKILSNGHSVSGGDFFYREENDQIDLPFSRLNFVIISFFEDIFVKN